MKCVPEKKYDKKFSFALFTIKNMNFQIQTIIKFLTKKKDKFKNCYNEKAPITLTVNYLLNEKFSQS